ncbi:MAG: DNA translocase FtsK 4TM domain-containing protein, partial [Rhodobacteraceae bacterium]|nr:DNA translocase FtsK 4TM domain-containing protein [Paracoccaceae bacterium]
MASYQARQRDPLLDARTQAAIERRGREMLGALLLALAAALAALLLSYSPDDPSWMAATDGPVQNLLGRVGAAAAAPLIIIAGKGALALPVVLAVWGLRLIRHRGEERAVTRLVFLPIAVALTSAHGATLVPGADWAHPFGLGGLFGDTVLGALLGVVPVTAAAGLKLVSLALAVLMAVVVLYAAGIDRHEARAIWRFVLFGLTMAWAGALAGLAAAGRGAVRAARRGGA